jgi:predicted Zn-dependent peptidase
MNKARLIRLSLVAGGLALCGNSLHAAAEAHTSFRLPQWKSARLENGITLLLMERRQLPLVSVRWVLRSGGSVCDPAGKEGLASLTAQMLRKGAGSRNATQLSDAIDFLGARLDADAATEFAAGTGEFMAKDVDAALGLLSDMLQKPSFPRDEFKKLARQEMDAITEAKAVPNEVIARYYAGFLYGPHAYGRPVSGTETTLPKISRADVATFHRTHYVPNQLILSFVGDFSAVELEGKLRRTFAGWKSADPKAPPLTPPAPVKGRRALLIEKPDATQTFFRVGNVGLERTNRDWAAVQIVNTLFGGRFTSIINSALRIDSGLTYGARSSFTAHLLPGAFDIASYTRNDTTAKAIELALEVLDKLHKDGISEQQLLSAKTYMKGQFGPTMETNDQLANALCTLEFYHLGPRYYDTWFEQIDAVSLADARRVIADHFPREDLCFVLIGQSDVISPAAAKVADAQNIKKKSITDPGF